MQKDTNRLYILDQDNNSYLAREGVSDFGFYSSQIILTVEERNGRLDIARIWFSLEDILYTDVTVLSDFEE